MMKHKSYCIFLLTNALWLLSVEGFSTDSELRSLNTYRDQARQTDKVGIERIENLLLKSDNQRDKLISAIFLSAINSEARNDLSEKYLATASSSPRGTMSSAFDQYISYLQACHLERNGDTDGAIELLNGSLSKAKESNIHLLYVEKLIRLTSIAKKNDQMLTLYEANKNLLARHNRFSLIFLVASTVLAYGDREKYLQITMDLAKNAPISEVSMSALNSLLMNSCEGQIEGSSKNFYISLDFVKSITFNASLNVGVLEWVKSVINGPVRVSDNQVRLLTPLEKAKLLVGYRQFKAIPEVLSLSKKAAKIANIEINKIGDVINLVDYSQATGGLNPHGNAAQSSSEPYEIELHKERLANFNMSLGKNYLASLQYRDLLNSTRSPTLQWKVFWNLIRAEQYTEAATQVDASSIVKTADRQWKYWLSTLDQLHENHSDSDDPGTPPKGNIFDYILRNKINYNISFVKSKESPLFLEIGRKSSNQTSSEEARHTYCIFSQNFLAHSEMTIDAAWINLIDSGCYLSLINPSDKMISRNLDVFTGSLNANRYPIRLSSNSLTHLNLSKNHILIGNSKISSETSRAYMHVRQRTRIESIHDMIRNVGRSIEVDESLIKAIIIAESGFDIMARSKVGASGLMQIMPFTAMKIALELNDDRFSIENVNTPIENVFYGTFYLKKLLKYYDNHLVASIAAYNAGPYWTNRWIDNCRDCREDIFVDSIPFKETRDYIKRVVALYAMFQEKSRDKRGVSPQYNLAKIHFSGLPPF